MGARVVERGARGGHALGDVAQLREHALQEPALREAHAHFAVARQIARAGEDQVAQPREAREGLRPSTHRHAEA